MSKYTILSPVEHKDIRIITSRGEAFGENTNIIPVIATEVRSLVTEYPMCFLKDPDTGQFGLYALTGLAPGSNLYLQSDKWKANYVPIHIRRQPFLMGVTGDEGAAPTNENTVVTFELSHKRVNKVKGEALFDEDENPTDYLKNISNLLIELSQGIPTTHHFIRTLMEEGLIEQLQLTITQANGEPKAIQGIYGLDEEKLNSLNNDSLKNLYDKGYLQACYLIMSSITHIQKLVNWQKIKDSKDDDTAK